MLRERLTEGRAGQLSYTLAARKVEVELSVRTRGQQVPARDQEAAKRHRRPAEAHRHKTQASVGRAAANRAL